MSEHRQRKVVFFDFSSIMAKWGEGDPRWIVEERADGTNVNNWHWCGFVLEFVVFMGGFF